jgi:GntR family transcriptional regulator, phosphonate transport system regulatory protein
MPHRMLEEARMTEERTKPRGINLWRHIGDTLIRDIDLGVYAAGSQLPTAENLAARFQVNRLTVLRAYSHLEREGLVRVEPGRGTFVTDSAVKYRFGSQTRFEENMLQNRRVPTRRLIDSETLNAPPAVAEALQLPEPAEVALITLLSEADDVPISLNFNYFPLEKFPGIVEAFRKASRGGRDRLSTSAVLRTLGVKTYRRKNVRMHARPPTDLEVKHLGISMAEYVVEADVLNVDDHGDPVIFGRTSFPSSRVEFVFDL